MAPDLVREFVRTFNDEVNRTRRDGDHRRQGLQREQKDLERRIDTLLEAFASGVLKSASVQAKLEALEARQVKVAKELAGLSAEPVGLHPNLAELYRRKMAALQDLPESDATRTEAVEIIRSLVERVIFRSTAEAGLEIELVGDIAGMVHLAQHSNENSPVSGAVHEEFTRSVKVVVGARNHLTFARTGPLGTQGRAACAVAALHRQAIRAMRRARDWTSPVRFGQRPGRAGWCYPHRADLRWVQGIKGAGG
jgi:site-specific DNA recombinase